MISVIRIGSFLVLWSAIIATAPYARAEPGFVGMQVQGVGERAAAAFKKKITGVLVKDVAIGEAAALAGFRRGDLIVKFDRKDVKTFEDLIAAFVKPKPGKKVSVVVMRDGKRHSLSMRLGKRPQAWKVEKAGFKNYPLIGFTVSAINAKIREQFALPWGSVGLVVTLVVNWLIKPFTMAALGVLFFNHVFAGLIPPDDAQAYLAGVILLGAAPCTAMVFVWSNLTRGDATYTLVQVSVNDVIMVFAFAPIVAFLLGVTDITVPWDTLLISVGLYVMLPLLAGYLTRERLEAKGGEAAVDAFKASVQPFAIMGLLLTVVLLFGFQGEVILGRPLVIALIAVPLLLQSYGIFFIAYGAARAWGIPYNVAAPCALIGTSNFFELAVAVAISLFGLGSGAALATVVGVLVEVPVMLSLVAFANRTQHWFPVSK